MQVPQQSRMGEAQKNTSGYISGYVEGNSIGEKGCRRLSKAAWGELELIRLDKNKIGDRSCRHISRGGWLLVIGVEMGINQNNSEDCGVREEGCRAMAKWQRHLERISCIFIVTKVMTTKSD